MASAAHLLALLIFGAGVFLSYQPENLWFVYGTMLVGLGLYSFGQHHLRRWGPRYRFDRALVQSLKGLDQRYTLAAFVDPALPDYLIIGPQGIVPLIVRPQSGTIVCRNDQWARQSGRFGVLFKLFGPALKNPTADARAAATRIREFFARRSDEPMDTVPITPSVVFLHPQAHLRIDGCSVPVTSAKELRAHLRRGKPAISKHEIEDLLEILRANVAP